MPSLPFRIVSYCRLLFNTFFTNCDPFQVTKRVSRDEKEVSRLFAQVQSMSNALKGTHTPHLTQGIAGDSDNDAAAAADSLLSLPAPAPCADSDSVILQGQVPLNDPSNMDVEAGVTAVSALDTSMGICTDTDSVLLADSVQEKETSQDQDQDQDQGGPSSSHNDNIPPLIPSPSPNSNEGTSSDQALMSPPHTAHQLLEEHLTAGTASLSEALEKLSRSRAEEESCMKKSQMEELRIEETTEWMLAMQGVLWPENGPDRELGRPVLPQQPPSLTSQEGKQKATDAVTLSVVSSTIIEIDLDGEDEDEEGEGEGEGSASSEPLKHAFYAPVPCPPNPNRASVSFSKSKDFLTYGMCNALDAARLLRILEVVDVDTMMEAFRWMAWCHRCLHVLRIPPATQTLKRLLACCRPFKLADDKILKAVGGILSRSLAWKSKVRKLIFPGVRLPHPTLPLPHLNVSMDTTRLHSLIAEGGMVPMTSKLKDHLVRTWDEAVLRAANAPAISSQTITQPQSVHGSSHSTGPTGKIKRTPKSIAIPPVSGIAKSITISMAGDVAESSDDDDGDAAEEDSKRSESSSASDSSNVTDETLITTSLSSSSTSPRTDSAPSLELKKKQMYDRELSRAYVYTTLSPAMWAPLPALWPPSLSVRQVSTSSSGAPISKSGRVKPIYPLLTDLRNSRNLARNQTAPTSSSNLNSS